MSLRSEDDDWTGDPAIDRMRLVQRAHDEMRERQRIEDSDETPPKAPHLKAVPRLTEEELVRLEQGTPEPAWVFPVVIGMFMAMIVLLVWIVA